jgi:hypothetical protein
MCYCYGFVGKACNGAQKRLDLQMWPVWNLPDQASLITPVGQGMSSPCGKSQRLMEEFSHQGSAMRLQIHCISLRIALPVPWPGENREDPFFLFKFMSSDKDIWIITSPGIKIWDDVLGSEGIFICFINFSVTFWLIQYQQHPLHLMLKKQIVIHINSILNFHSKSSYWA